MARCGDLIDEIDSPAAGRARALRAKKLLAAIEFAEITGKIRFLNRQIDGLQNESASIASSAEQIKARLRGLAQIQGDRPATSFFHGLAAKFRSAISSEAVRLEHQAGMNSETVLKLQFDLGLLQKKAADSVEKRDSCNRAGEAIIRARSAAWQSAAESEVEEIITSRKIRQPATSHSAVSARRRRSYG